MKKLKTLAHACAGFFAVVLLLFTPTSAHAQGGVTTGCIPPLPVAAAQPQPEAVTSVASAAAACESIAGTYGTISSGYYVVQTGPAFRSLIGSVVSGLTIPYNYHGWNTIGLGLSLPSGSGITFDPNPPPGWAPSGPGGPQAPAIIS